MTLHLLNEKYIAFIFFFSCDNYHLICCCIFIFIFLRKELAYLVKHTLFLFSFLFCVKYFISVSAGTSMQYIFYINWMQIALW